MGDACVSKPAETEWIGPDTTWHVGVGDPLTRGVAMHGHEWRALQSVWCMALSSHCMLTWPCMGLESNA